MSQLDRIGSCERQHIIIRPRRSRNAAAYSRQTFPRTICRSVCLSSALWKNGGSDPDAVWHHRSDGTKDEARSGVWGSVHGKGANLGRAIVTNGDLTAYVWDSAATRPSSQITLGRLFDLWLLHVSDGYDCTDTVHSDTAGVKCAPTLFLVRDAKASPRYDWPWNY